MHSAHEHTNMWTTQCFILLGNSKYLECLQSPNKVIKITGTVPLASPAVQAGLDCCYFPNNVRSVFVPLDSCTFRCQKNPGFQSILGQHNTKQSALMLAAFSHALPVCSFVTTRCKMRTHAADRFVLFSATQVRFCTIKQPLGPSAELKWKIRCVRASQTRIYKRMQTPLPFQNNLNGLKIESSVDPKGVKSSFM